MPLPQPATVSPSSTSPSSSPVAPLTLAQPDVVPPAASGPWAWRSAPKWPRCPDGVPFRYCHTLADGVDFLHWQQEQQSAAEKAIADKDGQYREERGRREALEGGGGVSLGQVLGTAGGIVGALGVGIFVGWLWGHFSAPRNSLEVPGASQSGLKPLGGVPLP